MNLYSLGNILRVRNTEEGFRALLVSSRGNAAVLLVLTGENTGDLLNTESLQNYELDIVIEMKGRLPETRYFFQKSAAERNIKSIEFNKNELKEENSVQIFNYGGVEPENYERQRKQMRGWTWCWRFC